MSQSNFTCPQILVIPSSDAKPTTIYTAMFLPIYSIFVYVEIHCSVAFVCIRTSFLNTTGSNIDGIYTYPTSKGKATITSCDIMFADKVFNTIVVDSNDATYPEDKSLHSIMEQSQQLMKSQLSNAKGFQMPFHTCPPNSEIVVDMKYTQDLSFNATIGDFELIVPLLIPPSQPIYQSYSLNDVISIITKIYPGNASSSTYDYKSNSHKLVEMQRETTCVVARNQITGNIGNADYHISYHVWSKAISVDCIIQSDVSGKDGSMVLFLSPPNKQQAKSIPRNIIFLLDHSGSMSGDPLSQAKLALMAALDSLDPLDNYAICAFDDKMLWYPENAMTANKLLPANKSSLQQATTWIQSINASGLTNILTPYEIASNILLSSSTTTSPSSTMTTSSSPSAYRPLPTGFNQPTYDTNAYQPVTTQPPMMTSNDPIPTIILFTDGAVYDEVAICNYAKVLDAAAMKSSHPAIRTFTFGIGPYCNQCFLKLLGFLGHGYSDVCLFPELLYHQMTALMSKTMKPVYTSIHIDPDTRSSSSIIWYPDAIPDLCVGSPLMLCGRYHGDAPRMMIISGTNADGLTQHFEVTPSIIRDHNIPLHQLVARQMIEYMIGLWWMQPDYDTTASASSRMTKKTLRDDVVATSVESNIPCVFTSTIAYEDKDAMKHHHNLPVATSLPSHPATLPTAVPIGTFASSAAASRTTSPPTTSSTSNTKPRQNNRLGRSYAIQGAIILSSAAATAVIFGSVAATNSNLGILDAMMAITSYGFNTNTFNSLGVVFNHIEGIGGQVYQFTATAGREIGHTIISSAQGVAPDITHAAHVVGSGIQAGARDIESGVIQAVNEVPSLMRDISTCCGSCCSQLSSCDFINVVMTVINFLGQLLGHIIGFLGDVLSGCGDCCGALCSGDLFSQIIEGIGSCCGAIGDFGNICGVCGDIISGCGDICGGLDWGAVLGFLRGFLDIILGMMIVRLCPRMRSLKPWTRTYYRHH